MNFKINLDFCVIPNPYNKGFKNLVFISYRGANKIDEKLCLEQDYEHLKNVLWNYGYKEINYCVFESSNNTTIRADELKSRLSEAGLRYSKPFEFNINGELESFNLELMSQIEEARAYPALENIQFSTTSKAIKSKVPAVGEKIVLHFYLFLQCNWINENDCVLDLVGDLYSKENNNTRNFLQITKSEFVRLDAGRSDEIILQSVKTYGDFVNEINILHKGIFKFVKPIMSKDGEMVIKTKEFTYNIIEIKKNINPIHRINVEAKLNLYYDGMMSVSKKIKKELSLEQKRIVSLEAIRPEMLSLKQKLKDKMLTLAETEEFEKANNIKTDVSFIENKIQAIDGMEEKNITFKEYFKTFCLSS